MAIISVLTVERLVRWTPGVVLAALGAAAALALVRRPTLTMKLCRA